MANVAEAPAITCPAWCVSAHEDETTFHMQADKAGLDIYGKRVNVSVFWDENTGQSGVYLGAHELTWEQAAIVANLVTDASTTAAQALLSR